jgi:hypothetical protein
MPGRGNRVNSNEGLSEVAVTAMCLPKQFSHAWFVGMSESESTVLSIDSAIRIAPRIRWLAKGNAVGQAHFIAELFGPAAERIQQLTTCARLNSFPDFPRKPDRPTLSMPALAWNF